MRNQICTCAHDDMCAYGLRQVFRAHRFHPEPRAARASAARRVCRGEPEHVRANASKSARFPMPPLAAPGQGSRRRCARRSFAGHSQGTRSTHGTRRVPAVLTWYSQVPRAREGRGAHARAAEPDGLRRRPGTSTAEYCRVLKQCYRVLQSTAEKSGGM